MAGSPGIGSRQDGVVMASGYSIFPRAIFHEPEIRGLSDRAFRLATYVLCGPHASIVGCYRLPDGYIAADLGWSLETVQETVAELIAIGFLKRLSDGQHILLPKFFAINGIANPNVLKAALRQIAELPVDPEIAAIFQWLEPFAKGFKKGLPKDLADNLERLRKAFANTEIAIASANTNSSEKLGAGETPELPASATVEEQVTLGGFDPEKLIALKEAVGADVWIFDGATFESPATVILAKQFAFRRAQERHGAIFERAGLTLKVRAA